MMTKNSALRNTLKGCLSIYFVFLFLLIVTSFNNIKQRFDAGTLFLTGHEQECQAVDFVSVYISSQIANRCATKRDCFLYDRDIQFALTNEILKPFSLGERRVVEYPPYFYIFMYPLSFFGLKEAWVFFTGFNLVIFIAGLIYVARKAAFDWLQCALVVLWALAYGPVTTCLKVGQLSICLAAALTVFWIFMEKRRYVAAAFVTAIGIVKIQYLPFVLVCGLVLGKKKYAFGLIAAYSTLLLACLLMFGPSAVFGYPGVLLQSDQSRWSSLGFMENFRGQCFGWLPMMNTTMLLILSASVMVGAIILLAAIWKKYDRQLLIYSEQSSKFSAAVSTLLMLAFSLHTFTYDYVASLVPCIWLYVWLDKKISTSLITYYCLKIVILLFPLIHLSLAVLQLSVPMLGGFKFDFLVDCLILILCLQMARFQPVPNHD